VADSVLLVLSNGKDLRLIDTRKLHVGTFDFYNQLPFKANSDLNPDGSKNQQLEQLAKFSKNSCVFQMLSSLDDIKPSVLQSRAKPIMNYSQCTARSASKILFMG